MPAAFQPGHDDDATRAVEDAAHVRTFTELVSKQLAAQKKANSPVLTPAKIEATRKAVRDWAAASAQPEMADARKRVVQEHCHQVYTWADEYDIVTFDGTDILIVYKYKGAVGSSALDTRARPIHTEEA